MDGINFGLQDAPRYTGQQDISRSGRQQDPSRHFGLQDPARNNENNQHTMSSNVNLQDMSQTLTASNILDERGDSFLSSILNSNQGDMLVTNDNNFLLATMMAPPLNKTNFNDSKESTTAATLPSPVQVNSSPVKKVLDKAKQSPFKKRGNFEEETISVTYPKSDSKDYCHGDLPRQLMGKMFGLLKEGLFCDSVILSGSTEIRVHRLVLLAACPFILSKMADKSQDASLRIELPQGIPLDVTSQLVHYLYDGKVTLTSDNVAHFARVANLFKLTHLLDICKDFVIMFGIGQSILLDKGEDVIAIVKNDNASKNGSNKETKLATKRSLNKSPAFKTPESAKKSVEELNVEKSTPSHSYSTRRSTLKTSAEKTKTTTSPQNNLIKNSPSFTSNSPPKHPIHTNAAFINSNRTKLFSDTSGTGKRITTGHNIDQPIKSSVETGSRITASPEQKGSTSFSEDMTSNDEKANDDNDEPFDNIDELTDDCDEDQDWKPHTKLKGRPFTKKGRAAKAFKKSYASFLKTAKPKKVTVVPEQKESYTLRPPPKKRAKEFARTEFEELEDILSRPAEKGIIHTFSMETKTEPQDSLPQRPKRTQRLLKASSYRASQLSAVVAQIEQRADHLPENERHFICDICGNHYVFSKRAVTHIISVHDTELEDVIGAMSIRKKEKVLKMCDICGYETKEPNFFYIHFHRYFRHGVPLPKGMQPFKCDICGKECFTRFQLKDHKLVHQEGTPFICETCGIGFTSRTCLTSHMFHKHSKVRNHKCTDYGCEKTFKTKTQLLVHMRSHTGEKPFQCPDCQYKSTTRGNMRLHLTNKHKHHADIVKNIMANLKPSQGDELLVDLDRDGLTENDIKTSKGISQTENFTQTILTNQEGQQLIFSNAPTSSHVSQTSDVGYTISNPIGSAEQQILYDPNDPSNRPITIQQLTAQQSLLLNNIPPDQLELLPNDQNLDTIQGNQGLIQSENLKHHFILHDPHNTAQNQNRLSDINRITMQDTRLLLQQQDHGTIPKRQNDLQHQQRSSMIEDTNDKSLPQLVEVQEIHPVYLQDEQNVILPQYDRDQYTDDDDQVLLHNNASLLHNNPTSQEQVLITSSAGNQSHLPKIQITIQNRGQLESAGVQGLILSPSHNTSQGNQDNRHQIELLEETPTKGPTKMYLVDVNNLSGVDVDNVQASVEQSQLTNTAPSVDSNSSLSQSYNDPQLLYQLYQQYNQSYQ